MERRLRLVWLGLIPVILTVSGFLALAAAEPVAQQAPEASTCVTDLAKWLDPEKIDFGQTTGVTLVVSGTCPAEPLPVDLVIVADESNSMTPPERGPILRTPVEPTKVPTAEGTVKPTEPPPPGSDPTGTPGRGSRGGEPPFCNPDPGGGSDPIASDVPDPTKGPTPEPTVVPPAEPFQGPIVPPPGPIITQAPVEPTMTIEELEPSGSEDEIRNVQGWVRDLMRQDEIENDMNSGRLRMGFVAFSKRARVRQSLTSEPGRINSAVGRMKSGDITKIDQGLREAERILFGTGGRYKVGDENRVKVILVLSDFQFCQKDMRISGRLRDGVTIVTQGFGVRNYDIPKVREIASDNQYAFVRASVQGFIDIYNDDLGVSRPVGVETLYIRDELQGNMRLIPGSADPPTVTITGQLLEWELLKPSLPVTLGYSVQPLEAGVHPVSVEASAAYSDTEGLPGGGPFPPVSVEVAPPTPTPTATNTATATATATNTPTSTPTPGPKYIPIAYRNWPEATPTPVATECIPEEQTVDVALVIDTSTSMSDPTHDGGQPKLDAAIEAAEELVALMKPDDQVTVIGFNRTSYLATQLTSDKATMRWALSSLPATQAQGTSIDLGLAEALAELESPRHKDGNQRSIVLVTDGRQTGLGGTAAVRAVAQRIDAANIKLITVGLGSDVDEDLLRDIATTPDLYFPAPNAEELKDIYREIARVIPC